LYAAERALARCILPGLNRVAGAKVAVQGFGNAGALAAKLFQEAGAVVVAVSDSQGAVYRESGLDVGAVTVHKGQRGSVVGAADTRSISNAELLAFKCDILIPAALENQIRADNADSVQARLIAEAANGPTTPAADRILHDRGIPVLPDILANSGGVCVSYFEWVQNIENEQWDLDEVNQKLRTKMERATNTIIDRQADINRTAAKEGIPGAADLRTAALVVAIERVAKVALERGIWP
jgi:glutamate dehydrogenase (NAD(P)+)